MHQMVDERGMTLDVAGPAETGAGLGGLLGGTLGLAASLTSFAVPGAGPIDAASPMVMALTGASLGAIAGALIGALTEEGAIEGHARRAAESVRREAARIAGHAQRAAAVMRDTGAGDIDQRVSRWRDSGWTAWSESALPYSPDEAERERRQFGTHADPLTGLPLTADPELDNVLETSIRR